MSNTSTKTFCCNVAINDKQWENATFMQVPVTGYKLVYTAAGVTAQN